MLLQEVKAKFDKYGLKYDSQTRNGMDMVVITDTDSYARLVLERPEVKDDFETFWKETKGKLVHWGALGLLEETPSEWAIAELA